MNNFRDTWRKKGMPCRIGTTSYIIPADILPNLAFLKDVVEDVELVLFESDEYSNLPTRSDVREMGVIAESAGLSFTVHLPLDAWPGSADESVRTNSVDKWLRVMDLMAPLSPFGWVVHLNDPPAAGSWDQWLMQCDRTIDALIDQTDPELLCVETLSYDFERVYPLVVEKGCSVCMDIGHLLLTNRDVPADLAAWFGRTRIIHLHGVNAQGRDHVGLGHMDPVLLTHLVAMLKDPGHFPRVLTLEVFSLDDLQSSLSVLESVI